MSICEFAREPVIRDRDGWWFFTETWTDDDMVGPFKRWETARSMLMAYCLDRRGVGDQDLLYLDVNKAMWYGATRMGNVSMVLTALQNGVITLEEVMEGGSVDG